MSTEKTVFLLPGIYKADNRDDDNYLNHYEIVLEVKETEKSYIFRLIQLDSRYSGDHIKLLFEKTDRVVLRKAKGGHAMRKWSDHDFTIYPFQAGIPFYFRRIEQKVDSKVEEELSDEDLQKLSDDAYSRYYKLAITPCTNPTRADLEPLIRATEEYEAVCALMERRRIQRETV